MQGYVFDIWRFYADLGGVAAVHRRLLAMGFDVQWATVKKWRERNDIALPYVVALFAHRALNEGPMDFNRYLSSTDDVRRPRRPLPAGSAQSPPLQQTAAVQG